MGFLSVYDGSTKVIVDEERDYWVELSDYVSQGAKEEAERCLSKVVMVGKEAVPTPDVARYRQQMLLASIRAWNLDDDTGFVWPMDLKHVQKLPGHIFDLLWKKIDEQTKEDSVEDQRQFPAEDLGSGSDGDGGSADLLDLPAEA